MRNVLELPRLSLRERDRRWAAVRADMAARDLDCLVLWGWPLMWDFCIANARYLCPVGGNAEFNVLVFPRDGDPTCFVLMPTFLEGWRSAQDWVGDIRARKGTWADSVAERIKELKLERGRIGMDGLAGPLDPDGWLPHSVYLRLQELLSDAKLVHLDDMLEKVRTIKSDEELGILAKAAELGDLMLAACRDTARPGVKECEVYGRMVETMLAHGGEEPTLFLWACDRYPYPHPFRLPTTLKLHGASEKHILKLVLQKALPHDIVWRRKYGMGVPITQWTLGPMREQIENLLGPDSVRRRGLFQEDYVTRLRLGQNTPDEIRRRRVGERLWTLAMLEAWLRVFIDGRGRAPEGVA